MIVLWFLHYKARRFDYGMAAVMAAPWVHWQYGPGELEAYNGLDPRAAPETWMEPGGLLVGDYAPWDLSVYELVRTQTTVNPPRRVNFTFKAARFGDATSQEVMHVAIPEDRALTDRELRARCTGAKIQLI